jgi:hypothetical protein
MDDFLIQNLDEILPMDEKTKKNVGKFGLVPNLRPRFGILGKK